MSSTTEKKSEQSETQKAILARARAVVRIIGQIDQLDPEGKAEIIKYVSAPKAP